MGNPCEGIDTQRLRDAYTEARTILSLDISNAPDEIKCFDSYLSPNSPGEACQTNEEPGNRLRPMQQYNDGSKFMDCSFADNVLVFHEYASQFGWVP